MMNADGSNQSLLAGNGFGDYSPSWSASTAGNQPPVASAGGPYSGVVAQNVPFSGAGSFDPDGSISSYSWSFGDGGTGSGVSLTHTYASAGTYTVSLTVTDNLGAQTSATTTTSITTAASEGYLANFNLSALNRAPYTNESSYWNDILRAAYPNGQSSVLLAVRELGKTLFESSDYAARSRDTAGDKQLPHCRSLASSNPNSPKTLCAFTDSRRKNPTKRNHIILIQFPSGL
jgi:PKD repeat protein